MVSLTSLGSAALFGIFSIVISYTYDFLISRQQDITRRKNTGAYPPRPFPKVLFGIGNESETLQTWYIGILIFAGNGGQPVYLRCRRSACRVLIRFAWVSLRVDHLASGDNEPAVAALLVPQTFPRACLGEYNRHVCMNGQSVVKGACQVIRRNSLMRPRAIR